MYNGIGLETVRGSGTNGYVQRNLSALRQHRDKVDYKSEAELAKLDAQMTRGPNQEILDHERKRKVELKCMEMQELMEEQGYGAEEIEKKVSGFRQMLMQKSESSDTTVELDEAGRPIAKATHQMAEANQLRNEQLKSAFGIGEFYKEGSSFDKDRKAKENAARTLALAQAKYKLVQPDLAESSSESEPEQKKTKKRSSSPSPDAASKKKHKKHHRSSKSSSNKASEGKSRKESSTDDAREKRKKHKRDK